MSSLKRILPEIEKKTIQQIEKVGNQTIITFDDQTTLPLTSSNLEIESFPVMPVCSFCQSEQTSENPLMGPLNKNEPCICKDCACRAVEIFAEHGISIELQLPIEQSNKKE